MTIIFDGKKFAREKEVLLRNQVTKLLSNHFIPKLVSILVGDDPASVLYVSLKKKAAERIGADLQVVNLGQRISAEKIVKTIEKYNKDKTVHGIMVQMPLPKAISNYQLTIINSIAKEKDVDGLREDSLFLPATVRAIIEIIKESGNNSKKVAVVGSTGMVGKPLIKILNNLGYKVQSVDVATSYKLRATKSADILITATGVPGLIKENMVKKGAVVIDVGSPKGDVDRSVFSKASFITPVPGGVGPVTISCLLENLVEAAYNKGTHTQGIGS